MARYRVALRLAVCALVLAAVACAEPLEFPAWTIEIPEGTPVHGYAPVTADERAGAPIELVEDLLIGERGDDLNYAFGQVTPRVAVDERGNIYALDSAESRVQAFDPRGEYRFTIGREGQGPGEFGRPVVLTVAGDEVVVFDSRANRFSRFGTDGTHIADHLQEETGSVRALVGNPDGSLTVARVPRREGPDEEPRIEIVRIDASGSPLGEFFRAAWDEGITYQGESNGRVLVMGFRITPQPELAALARLPLYFSALDEYQVISFDPAGEARWALRVASPRPPLPRERVEWGLGLLRRRFPEVRESELDWPEAAYALSRIEVDGHGHLFAFPTVEAESDEPVPVDVYGVDGERLFAGTMPPFNWDVALGDNVYGAERDDNGEWQLVRYRLVEPFE